jgi:hypothetical protein
MVANKSFRVQVQKDYLEKLSSGQPAQCMAELIWNALDAEATTVQVEYIQNELGVEQIRLIDNGHGIAYHDAEVLFSSLGGSWKASQKHSSNRNRFLHGQEGKGRFKAFGLGSLVTWDVAYEMDGQVWSYSVWAQADAIDFFNITEPQVAQDGQRPGVTVTISNLFRHHAFFDAGVSVEVFSPVFAQYLQWYPEVKIVFDQYTLSPEKVIRSKTEYPLQPVQKENQEYGVYLEIVEWKGTVEKGLFFCNENGFPLDKYSRTIKVVGDFVYTAYLKTGLVTHLFNSGVLSLHQMDESFNALLDTVQQQIQNHFLSRQKEEAKNFLDLLRDKSVYPYTEKPQNAQDKKERQLFDTIAIALQDLIPEFRTASSRSQALQLRLLRQAIEHDPKALQNDLLEVLQPPMDIKKELQKAFEKGK